MILLTLLSISFLAVFGLKNHENKEDRLIIVTVLIYIFSLLPSINIPYIIDDIDHLFNLSHAIKLSKLTTWMFLPHNEHVIPSLKFLYFISYKYFWLNPQFFHLVIIAVFASILFLTYYCLLKITNSRLSSFIGTALLASTNLMDNAIFVITNSHIVFCLALFLLLFFSQFHYMKTRRLLWLCIFVLCLLLIPTTFALGLTSIFFVVLFHYLCIPKEYREPRDRIMLIAAIAWIISLIPYIMAAEKIIYAQQYQNLGKSSAFEIMNIPNAIVFLYLFLNNDIILFFLINPFISLFLFITLLVIMIKNSKEIEWRKIIFLLIFGCTINLTIFTFRVAWHPMYLSVARYNVFPAVMFACIYAVSLTPLINRKYIHSVKIQNLIIAVCFIFISYSGAIRYGQAETIAAESSQTLQRFNVEFRGVFEDYFRKYPQAQNLRIKNEMLHLTIPSLTTRKGFTPDLTRNPRQLSFFADYILSNATSERLIWSESTDDSFLRFLKESNELSYITIKTVFKDSL